MDTGGKRGVGLFQGSQARLLKPTPTQAALARSVKLSEAVAVILSTLSLLNFGYLSASLPNHGFSSNAFANVQESLGIPDTRHRASVLFSSTDKILKCRNSLELYSNV
jgi:hypothetical protein